MNDFVSSGWSIWVASVAILGIIFCIWLLWSQRNWLGQKTVVDYTGHEWDGVREYNHPLPRWWIVMYLGLCAIAVGIVVLYPALGSFDGLLGYTSQKEVAQAQEKYYEQIAPVYEKYREMEVEDIAHDSDARLIGERLFLNNCAQCHGSDARGSTNYPNLTNDDWLHGGEPKDIIKTITDGRNGVMAPLAAAVKPDEADAIANYVRSLSGLSHDATLVAKGEKGFKSVCAACHGMDAKGNTAIGAPNLSDDIWLGSSSKNAIIDTIMNGRNNVMPAQKNHLTEDQIRMLAAYVWGLSNVE